MKKCIGECGLEKSEHEFWKGKNPYYQKFCLQCYKKYRNTYYSNNKEKHRARAVKSYYKKQNENIARNREYRRLNKKEISEKAKINRRHNIIKYLLHAAKKSAKHRSINFDLKESDIVLPDVCPVLGISLSIGDGQRNNNSYSLDRIDNNKGYVVGNVRVISWRANNVKGDACIEELEKILKYMKGENKTNE